MSDRVATLLKELADPGWASLTTVGVVAETIAAVTAVHKDYVGEVKKFETLDKASWDEVKSLDLANHRRLCNLVAGIVFGFAADAAVRKSTLAPVAQQDLEIYEALRARRKVLDIDPSTGEPIPPVAPSPPEPVV